MVAQLVIKSGHIVGHVPLNLAHAFSQFLKRFVNRGTTEIGGEKVNRGSRHGLKWRYCASIVCTDLNAYFE